MQGKGNKKRTYFIAPRPPLAVKPTHDKYYQSAGTNFLTCFKVLFIKWKSMANMFIYSGFTILLIGAAFGLIIAVKGYKETDWGKIKRISYFGDFQRGEKSLKIKRLTRIWCGIMIAGFIVLGIGLSIGLN